MLKLSQVAIDLLLSESSRLDDGYLKVNSAVYKPIPLKQLKGITYIPTDYFLNQEIKLQLDLLLHSIGKRYSSVLYELKKVGFIKEMTRRITIQRKSKTKSKIVPKNSRSPRNPFEKRPRYPKGLSKHFMRVRLLSIPQIFEPQLNLGSRFKRSPHRFKIKRTNKIYGEFYFTTKAKKYYQKYLSGIDLAKHIFYYDEWAFEVLYQQKLNLESFFRHSNPKMVLIAQKIWAAQNGVKIPFHFLGKQKEYHSAKLFL